MSQNQSWMGFNRVMILAACLLSPVLIQAQSWSWDARRIGMGGSSGSGNLASKMIEDQRNYTSIVLPLGLVQVLRDTKRFNPNSPEFNPILDLEYAATPWHYVVGRGSNTAGESTFVNDVRNGTLSRDLTRYKGFVPANDFLSEGLVAPSFGHSFKVHRSPQTFQAFYVGVGPYLSLRSQTSISSALTTVLASGVNQSNAAFPIAEADQEQAAAAVIGGYRARFALPGMASGQSEREGIYIAANYNYLRGFAYNSDDLAVTLLTDGKGLIRDASNVVVANRHSTRGTGRAVDIGIGAVVRSWEFGFGAKGIGNQLAWTRVRQRTLTLASVVAGIGDFVNSPTIPGDDMRIKLPVDYRGNAAYYARRWTAAGEVGHGFGGGSFHGGAEWHAIRGIELRGGARYSLQKLNPTGGIGFNVSRRLSFDLAAFGTTANIEQKRQVALAASIRFNHLKGAERP